MNLNGPLQTGCKPKSRPSASAALGATIMPARSVSSDKSGEEGDFSTSRTVSGSTTWTWSDDADLGAAEAAWQGQVTLQPILHGLGVEGFAVVEGDVGAQVDHQGPGIGPFVAEGELRDDLQFLVDVEQLVAQTGEHDAPDIGPGEGRVQNVGVLTQGDVQGGGVQGLGEGRRGCQRCQDGCHEDSQCSRHVKTHDPGPCARPQPAVVGQLGGEVVGRAGRQVCHCRHG